MKKVFLFTSLFFIPFLASAQVDRRNAEQIKQLPREMKENRKNINSGPAPIDLYKIISVNNDTTTVDTSLTIYEDYSFNYLRKDNFELLPFPNVGQTYNRLAYDFSEREAIFPLFGAQARHYNFMEVDDIYYYHVPTPFTELLYKTVLEQGQLLDALFTVNISPNFNFSIAYKGLRSLGRYQHMLTSTGNFRFTTSYNTASNRYHLKAHFVSQDLLNEENGGLTSQSLRQYIDKLPEFDDRSRLEVNFEDAQSTLKGKRFYLEHSFDLYKVADSAVTRGIALGHKLDVGSKDFLFQQANANNLFGPSFENTAIKDKTELDYFYNELFVEFSSGSLGKLRGSAGYKHYTYGYNSVVDLETQFVPSKLTGEVVSAGGSYQNKIGKFDFNSKAQINLTGDFEGYNLEADLAFLLGETNGISVGATANSSAPAFNFLLNQSDYINYNWLHQYENEKTQALNFKLLAPKLVNLKGEVSRVESIAYFGINDEDLVKPFQANEDVNYARMLASREFKVGKFALNNTFLYQRVFNGEDILHVPDFITRNTLYFSDYWFQRALFLQTGLTFNYFSGYNMNGYDPVLAEFYVQNNMKMEGFPTVDFFFNGKIRTARIFVKLEHVDALINGNNNFSAPLYPYRDFALRFGLVWNFFM